MWKLYSQKTIDRLKKEASDNAVNNYKAALERAPTDYVEIDRVRQDCSVMLKFDNPHISIFSIERVNMNLRDERTIIGYVFTGEEKPVVNEWSLYISRKQHNELVEKYNRSNENSKPKKEV